MDKRLFRFTMLSVRRRWREVVRTFVAAFLAVFFVTGILIFEENMFEWQVASNKDRFGDWFVMEANVSEQSEALKNHPKLSGYAEAFSAMNLYSEYYNDNGSQVGYMSPEFVKMGCINLIEGRMPSADNEIAMDRNTLAKHGFSTPEVGQKVTIRYYEGNEAYEGVELQDEMILVGILEDYSNVWYRSRYLPGALVTKEKYEALDNERMVVYIYQLAESERHADHKAIYEELLSELRTKPAYNSYVYDYKPWSSDNVYNYMYVLVMIIGIAALTYQLVVYKNSRKYSNELMRKLGATKAQVTAVTFVENVMMLLPAGAAGMVMAALTGKIVCLIIEAQMGVSFYYISLDILLKGLIAILVAVLASEAASLVLALKHIFVPGKDTAVKKVKKEKKGKSTLSNKHVQRTISFRFTKANKLTQNLGVRVFSLGVCVILIMCSLRIYTTYRAYEENKDNIDVKGVGYVDKDYVLKVPFYVKVDNHEDVRTQLVRMGWDAKRYDPTEFLYYPSEKEIKDLLANGKHAEGASGYPYIAMLGDDNKMFAQMHLGLKEGVFYKEAKNNVTAGLSETDIEVIENIVGVEEVSYSTYETQRAWSWEGMSIIKMGYSRLAHEKLAGAATIQPYGTRNIFATEYINPTEEMYQRLCKYIEPAMQDYDAFVKGEQVLILLEENPNGEFDDSLSAGKKISYHYYDYPWYRDASYGKEESVFVTAYDGALFKANKAMKNKLWDEAINNKNFDVYNDVMERLDKNVYRNNLEPAVTTTAAAVVQVTDDIREEFADILPSNSYYTAIASTELAEEACKKQNELMADYLAVDELTDDCQAKVAYNQLTVKYNMLASFSATDNIITKYCEENCIEYISYAAVNEKYRTDFINAILQYGITIIAVIVINMLISAIVVRNRLATRKQKTELLLRLGAQRKDVRKVYMIEAVREALWCVFTLPIVLVIQYVIYRRNI